MTLNSDTDYGQISTGTNIVLGGAFNVTLKIGYHPASGATFNVLSYSGHTGGFGQPRFAIRLDMAISLWRDQFQFARREQPAFIGTFQLLGTNAILSGTGGSPGSNYVVLASTNLTAIGKLVGARPANKFDGGGQFRYTNPVSPAKPRQFFIFKLP